MNGVLNINKPAGMTSHDVIDRLRRLLHEKKAGHTGTLDPDATGVLPVCLGKATKIIQFLQDGKKGYEGTITLGITTDTLDASGKVLDVLDSSHVDVDDVKRVFSNFVGETDQIPPMVSAVKVQGERLYRIARQGRTVSRTPRRIHIYDLELLDFQTMAAEHSASCTELNFRVLCSRGTYVRSLALDIGSALGCGAHLSRLVRTRSGIFDLKDSITLGEIQADPRKAVQIMRSMDDALSHIPMIAITEAAGRRFLNGIPVDRSEVTDYGGEFQADDVIRIHDEAGELLGLGKVVEFDASDPRAIICKVLKVLRTT